MKTLKYLKRALLWDIIFVVSLGISLLCFALGDQKWFSKGMLLCYLWMTNPLPAIYACKGLRSYFNERKDSAQKAQIGNRWVFLIIGWVIITLVWVFGGGIFVALTGGV